jgi:hypothetical protein
MVKGYFYSHKAERSNLARTLKGASKKRRTKIQAQMTALDALAAARTPLCNGQGNNSGGTNTAAGLKFDLSNASGLVLSDQNIASATFSDAGPGSRSLRSEAGSNLKKVFSNGMLGNALSRGKAQVSKFLVGPNNKLYVLFSQNCLYGNNCSERCLLGEVDTSSGDMSCVDNSLQSITWSDSANNAAPSSKPLQFDNAGNLYYMGSANGMTVLRKYDASTKSNQDLINSNITINGYLVLSDGSILYAGYTQSSSSYWLRKRLASGAIVPIKSDINVGWMGIFPDGRIYVGGSLSNDGNPSVFRLAQDSDELETVRWAAGSGDKLISYSRFESYPPFYRAGMLHTTAGSVFGLIGSPPDMKLFRLYPVPHVISTSMKSITGIRPVLSNLIVYGTDEDGFGRMVLYDTKTGEEEDLLGSAQVEVYRVEYLPNDNAVQFDALRFSDGKYVLCTVYLADNNALACSPTGSVKLADFQSVVTPGVRIPPPAATPTPIAVLDYDLNGAKALLGAYKIGADGSANLAARYAGARVLPQFTSDNANNLWLISAMAGGFYVTDQGSVSCKLARLSPSGGVPNCVFSGEGTVQLVRSQVQGGSFFVTLQQESNQSQSFKLFYAAPGGTATQIAAWQNGGLTDAMITSTGSLLVATYSWVRNFSSSGQFTAHDFEGTTEKKFGRLSDQRILVTGVSKDGYPGIGSFSADGEQFGTQLYAAWSGSSEVGCSAEQVACEGRNVTKLLQLDQNIFGIGYNSWNSRALLGYAPGPVRAITFAQPFIPGEVATSAGSKTFMSGLRNDAPTLLAYDAVTAAEEDLTDIPSLGVQSMEFIDGKLYMAATKTIPNGNGYCDLIAAIKTLGGGTSESKVGAPVWCYGGLPPLVRLP